MRIQRKHEDSAEADLTPMIDMTFLLIAFFVMLINFNDNDQQEVNLPKSEVAKPPEKPPEQYLVIHVTKEGKAIYGGFPIEVSDMKKRLITYKQLHQNYKDAVIIIRGDEDAKTGKVQELIEVCQEQAFDKFKLSALIEKDR